MATDLKIKNILVTGGSGKIGRATLPLLVDAGYAVRAIQFDDPITAKGVEIMDGSLADPALAPKAIEGMDAVIHLANVKENRETFMDVNIRGTFSLLDACKDCGHIRQYVQAGSDDAVGSPEETDFWQQHEFDIWGSKGRAWWIQNHEWGYQSDGMAAPRVEKTSWQTSDIPGQREFARAIAHWLDDAANVHANCLENALAGFEAIMAAFQSALVGRRLDLPAEIADDVVQQLEERLK